MKEPGLVAIQRKGRRSLGQPSLATQWQLPGLQMLVATANREETFPLDHPTRQREHATPRKYPLPIDFCRRCGGGFAHECVQVWWGKSLGFRSQLSETPSLQRMQGDLDWMTRHWWQVPESVP